MRKRYKDKDRSCGLCKPYKRGWDQRWKPKDAQAREEAEREIQDVRRFVNSPPEPSQ